MNARLRQVLRHPGLRRRRRRRGPAPPARPGLAAAHVSPARPRTGFIRAPRTPQAEGDARRRVRRHLAKAAAQRAPPPRSPALGSPRVEPSVPLNPFSSGLLSATACASRAAAQSCPKPSRPLSAMVLGRKGSAPAPVRGKALPALAAEAPQRSHLPSRSPKADSLVLQEPPSLATSPLPPPPSPSPLPSCHREAAAEGGPKAAAAHLVGACAARESSRQEPKNPPPPFPKASRSLHRHRGQAPPGWE